MSEEADHQRLETAYTLAKLLKSSDTLTEGQPVTLDLFFLPGPEADAEGVSRRFRMFGYPVHIDDTGALTTQAPETPLAFDAIWEQEDRTTKLAAQHGYLPDGWGFEET